MHKSTSFKALLVGGAVISATMIPLAGTSYAAASCYSLSCDNLGPVTYACDDDGIEARRVESADRVARLIWSAKCQAAWVNVKGTQGSTYNSFGYIERYNSSGTVLQKSLSVKIPQGTTTDWSNMLGNYSTGNLFRVCIRFQGDEYPLKCSTKY
ncbi:DUF2690 domain-containing protein [Streptomyces sp. NPDC059651]|uniref:DUF2690 domain-containing protein n=1 Tax=unclassified Streptomyces TaxID=2593676 RepID=UPI000AD8A3A2